MTEIYQAEYFKEDPIRIAERNKLRIVILECPYNTIQNPDTQSLLGRLYAFKIKGYQSAYKYGVLPVDTADLISNHILLCKDTDQGPTPVMGMKYITYDKAQAHGIKFPAYNILTNNLPLHEEAISIALSKAISLNERIAYHGSYTMDPDIKTNAEIYKLAKALTTYFLIQYYITYEIKQVIVGATLKFKIDRLMRFVGYEILSLRNEPLPAFQCPTIFGGEVAIMHLKTLREEAYHWSLQFNNLWYDRLVIGQHELDTKKAA